jgi:exodeoxyribonuclease V alpha subunit
MDRAELEGQIESVVYHNEENGYTVARVRVTGERQPVTVVGSLVSPMAGELVSLRGEWSTHPRYGPQFKIEEAQKRAPSTTEGIEKYLASGLIKGIGPEMARRIVASFGADTLEVIDRQPQRLSQIEGIGTKRSQMIRQAWKEQRDVRSVMVFLQSHGVSPAFAARIYRQYRKEAIKIVSENPYRLAEEVHGIGFLSADRIGSRLGYARDSQARAEAGLLHVLAQASDEGHVCLPRGLLLQRARKLLGSDPQVIEAALEALGAAGRVRIEALPPADMVYLPQYYAAETGIVLHLTRLLARPATLPPLQDDQARRWAQEALGLELAAEQQRAVGASLKEKVLVITGGPGTGKTTIMKAVLAILARLKREALLAAPTGRAAKRLSEVTGHPAKTIHRLLEYNQKVGAFRKNQQDPLVCDLLVIDEASMVDCQLAYQLLRAVPDTASLVLVGDVNQLPSVGAGNVLRDIIDSGRVTVVELTEIFRQARESDIVLNAHRIQQGLTPQLRERQEESDFYFVEQDEPERAAQLILEIVRGRIPRRFGFDAVQEVQVITPMHRGPVGVENLNRLLQEALNPGQDVVVRGNRSYRLGDKVMQLRNNYEKDVYNGDIGRVTRVDREMQELRVSYEGHQVSYDFSELDEVVPAYAVSVHKSQGCEFPAVVMPVMTQHYVLLQRNLLYTAVTRGKRLVVLVGTRKAMAIAIRNDRPLKRYTLLAPRLSSRVRALPESPAGSEVLRDSGRP